MYRLRLAETSRCMGKPTILATSLYIYKTLLPPPPPTPSNTPPSPHCLYDLQDIQDELVHSFQNRQIYPLKGFIVSTHRLSCPVHPPPPRLPLVQTHALTPLTPLELENSFWGQITSN